MRDALSGSAACAIGNNPIPTTTPPNRSRGALTGRCETFDCDVCRHYSHRAQVHDPDDEEDRRPEIGRLSRPGAIEAPGPKSLRTTRNPWCCLRARYRGLASQGYSSDSIGGLPGCPTGVSARVFAAVRAFSQSPQPIANQPACRLFAYETD
jgi:hypothetical protein